MVFAFEICKRSHADWWRLQMGEESNAFYIIEEGSVSVEANFLPDPSTPGSVDHPSNVLARLDSSRWCEDLP